MPLITHISDTARWVAFYRAMETERRDAIFRDPWARRLAGERGERIVREMPRAHATAWAMIVRTAVMDELLMRLVTGGDTDLVLNLAAGLDTRPWRLDLPPTLRWVDVDFPDVLEYKHDGVRDAQPRCAYEGVGLDLADVPARRALFERLGRSARAITVITEGLLIYLTADAVGALADDLHAQPSMRWWILDVATPLLQQFIHRSWGSELREGASPMRFFPAEGVDFYRAHGWTPDEFRSTGEEAQRLHREMRLAPLWRLLSRLSSAERREAFRRMSGVALLARAQDALREDQGAGAGAAPS